MCELCRRMPRRQRWHVVIAAFAGCLAVLALIALYYVDDEDAEVDLRPPPCQTGPTTAGIDVSYYQQAIAWKRVRRAGILFAFIRVSDGTTVIDPRFQQNWLGARKVGVLRGAYQYFRPDQSAIAQADLLIASIKRDPGELPPVIDVETDGGKSPAKIARAVEQWVARVRDKLGVEPIIYTGPEFWRYKVGGADMTSQPLWLAHYIDRCPTVPPKWQRWTFWQHRDTGRVPGITGPVDLNVFDGTYEQLEDFARRSRRPI